MMRFCSLGSGSTGNATLVEARSGNTVSRVLIDCGFSLRELERRLARAGLASTDIDAVHGGFMASPKHRAAILSNRYHSMGVGVAVRNGMVFVVQEFRG